MNYMFDINFDPFPTLYSDRLILRKIIDLDFDAIFELRSNSSILKYINRPPATKPEDVHDFMNLINVSMSNNYGINWGIAFKSDPQNLIGSIGIWKIDKENNRGTIGYALLTEYQNQGIGHESLEKVIQYGFKTLKLHSLEATVNPLNEASIRLLQKNGFVQEGYIKENHHFDGKYYDSLLFSLLNHIT
ncbi:MAG: GNAT family N-acetyltransferase [Saprospiraceae bacterium]|nr:GNAT family N-acetyltransferase [Saprospiraceae bacterium]